MRNKLIDTIVKVVTLSLIFIAPLAYLIWKFGDKQTEMVEVTTNSMPIPILIIVSIFAVMAISYIFSQTLHLIADNPFGFGSIFFFGSLMAIICVVAYLWLNKVYDLIDTNAIEFMANIDVYKHSILIVSVYIACGLVIGTGGFIFKKVR